MLLFQVITSRDIQSLLFAALMVAVLVAVAVIFRERLGNVLTRREWTVFAKLVGIVVMALLLIFTSIAVEFPAQQFIYGRF
jgi:hypothetical protein